MKQMTLIISPARILGTNDRVGSIEKDNGADIAIINDHPFYLFSYRYGLVSGEIVYEAKR